MFDAAEESPAPLTRDRIARTALAVVDRDGLLELSIQRLASELGVELSAACHHLPDEDALFDAVVEGVMAEVGSEIDDPAAPPEERIAHAAHAYGDAMLAHANALPIVLARSPSTPEALRPLEPVVGILRAAGLSPDEALAGVRAIAALVRGSIAPSADGATHGSGSGSADCEFGVRALARGLLAGSDETPETRGST